MGSGNANTEAKFDRLMVYLPRRSADALHKYISEKFSPRARVKTAVVTKAIDDFLIKEGYLEGDGGEE